MDNTGKRIELAVQARLMRRLLGMKMGPGERKPSEIFAAMRDFGSVREFFTSSTIGTIADLPFLIVFLLLVASIGGNLVWVLVLGGILMVAPGFFMQKRMMAITASTQGASTRSAKLLYESVFEHETVTTQRGEDRVKRIWSELVTLSAMQGQRAAQPDHHAVNLGPRGSAGHLYRGGGGRHLHGLCRAIHRGHDHRHRHPDRADAGPAGADLVDDGAVESGQGGADRAGGGCECNAGRRGGAQIPAARKDHRQL